jgi:hypothetical protein
MGSGGPALLWFGPAGPTHTQIENVPQEEGQPGIRETPQHPRFPPGHRTSPGDKGQHRCEHQGAPSRPGPLQDGPYPCPDPRRRCQELAEVGDPLPRRLHETPILQERLDATDPEKEEQRCGGDERNRTHPPMIVIIFSEGTLRTACLLPEGLGKVPPQHHE